MISKGVDRKIFQNTVCLQIFALPWDGLKLNAVSWTLNRHKDDSLNGFFPLFFLISHVNLHSFWKSRKLWCDVLGLWDTCVILMKWSDWFTDIRSDHQLIVYPSLKDPVFLFEQMWFNQFLNTNWVYFDRWFAEKVKIGGVTLPTLLQTGFT